VRGVFAAGAYRAGDIIVGGGVHVIQDSDGRSVLVGTSTSGTSIFLGGVDCVTGGPFSLLTDEALIVRPCILTRFLTRRLIGEDVGFGEFGFWNTGAVTITLKKNGTTTLITQTFNGPAGPGTLGHLGADENIALDVGDYLQVLFDLGSAVVIQIQAGSAGGGYGGNDCRPTYCASSGCVTVGNVPGYTGMTMLASVVVKPND
jgi:hypothetical protein